MNRDYDESSRNDTLTTIAALKDSIGTSSYSAPIDNTSVTGDLSCLMDLVRISADSASYSADKVREKLETLSTNLNRFYLGVDRVSLEIYRSAGNISSTLSGALKSMQQLETLLNTANDVNDITAVSIFGAFEPLKQTEKVYAYELTKALVAPGGYDDKATRDAYLLLLRKRGLTNLTVSDISNFCCIYKYLAKIHDNEWIVDRLELIFTSHYFNDIAVTGRYSSKDQDICLKMLEAELCKSEFSEMSKFYLLADNLNDGKGGLDPVVLGSFKEALCSRGISATDNDIRGYLSLISRMRSLGYTDEFIYESTSSIFGFSSLAGIYESGRHDGAGQTRLINEVIDKIICDRLTQRSSGNVYNDDFMRAIMSNTNPAKRKELLFFLESTDKSGYNKNDMVIELAKATLGIMEHDGRKNFFNQEYAHFGKEGVYWCANYTTWIIGQCGFLDGSLVDASKVSPDNAIDPNGPAWAAVNNMHSWLDKAHRYSEKEGYTPANGDLIMFSEPDPEDDEYHKNYYHVGIVAGVDKENNIVYTIEGNASGDGADTAKGVRLKAYKFDYNSIDGYVKMGGTEQNTSHIDNIMNKCTAVAENPIEEHTEEESEDEALPE